MAGSIAAYGLILVVVAPVVLTKVFGTAYAAANVLVLPMLVACTLDALWSGPALFLRARAKGARLLVGQAAYTTAVVGAVAVLVGVAGLRVPAGVSRLEVASPLAFSGLRSCSQRQRSGGTQMQSNARCRASHTRLRPAERDP